MIDINLIPDELKPKERSTLPYVVAFAVCALVGLVIFLNILKLATESFRVRQQLRTTERELEKLKDIVDTVELIEKQMKLAEEKKRTIVKITKNNIIWSRQLYELARLIPDNVWIDSIEEEPRQREVTYEAVNPRTKRKETKRRKVTYYVLKLVCYALPPEGQGEGVDLVGATLDALKANEELMRNFADPIFVKISTEELGGTRTAPGKTVKKFDVESELLRGSKEKPKRGRGKR